MSALPFAVVLRLFCQVRRLMGSARNADEQELWSLPLWLRGSCHAQTYSRGFTAIIDHRIGPDCPYRVLLEHQISETPRRTILIGNHASTLSGFYGRTHGKPIPKITETREWQMEVDSEHTCTWDPVQLQNSAYRWLGIEIFISFHSVGPHSVHQ